VELYVAWKHGYLAIDSGGRGLRVRGGNAILELGLREIGFQGPLDPKIGEASLRSSTLSSHFP